MSSTNITFFDMPTLLEKPTSPHTWKVRLVLNYKGLKYQTQWVPGREIETLSKSLGIPPTGRKPSGEPHYTVPALIDYTPSPPVILSDSTPIIEYLENTYPTPSRPIFPSGSRSLHAVFETFLATSVMARISPLLVERLNRTKFPLDQVGFRARMEQNFGKPFEEIEFKGAERERAWKGIETSFDSLAKSLAKNGGGPYFMGETISFSDFALCSFLIHLRNVSPDEAWVKISSWNNGRWADFFHACEEWMLPNPDHPISRL